MAWNRVRYGRVLTLVALLSAITLSGCSQPSAPRKAASAPVTAASAPVKPPSPRATAPSTSAAHRAAVVRVARPGPPLPAPTALPPFPGTPGYPGSGVWRPAGRLVAGRPAVYETLLVPPGGSTRAGIAWMDTRLLSARLYSGSVSPGGGPYKYTAPVSAAVAASLVAAFNGGFKMADAHGGYYTEGRMIRPLVTGAASLVIYADGSVTVGAWGSDVTMTPAVVAVRQNLFPLVIDGRPSPRAATRTWHVWGGTCPCGAGRHGTDGQWRSGLGVTADGALVYVVGPQLTPPRVAALLVRAGVVRGMELDINPSWPVFASFRPSSPAGPATAANGSRLTETYRGPATFFDPTYARDFITMSVRPPARRG